jgi:hypothetical protein
VTFSDRLLRAMQWLGALLAAGNLAALLLGVPGAGPGLLLSCAGWGWFAGWRGAWPFRRWGLRSRFDRRLTAALTSQGRVHHIWWLCTDRTYRLWHAWRVVCWLVGYHRPHHMDAYWEMCWVCGKSLWSRKRDGSPNPFVNPVVDRAPLRRRRPVRGGDR